MNKILGLLVGAALGDALGAPHEFHYCKESYTGKLEYPVKRYYRFQDRWVVGVVGQVTDDTEMMLIIARSLVQHGKYVREEVLKEYLRWANHPGTAFMGKNTRSLFKGVTTVKGYQRRYEMQKERSQSNGALMRSAILALVDDQDVITDCSLTNPDPICIDVNLTYVRAVRRLLCGEERKVVFEKAKEECKTEQVREVLEQVERKEYRDITKCKGWCLHALYCAFYCLLHLPDYTSSMRWIIEQKGDTDTNACIAGAMWGADVGLEKLFREQGENIEILLLADPSGGEIKREQDWTLYDLDILGAKLGDKFQL